MLWNAKSCIARGNLADREFVVAIIVWMLELGLRISL